MVASRSDLQAELARIGLRTGVPVIVLIGGAGALAGSDAAAAERVIRGAVVPAARACGAAVVDGGTDSGVMRMAGAARAALGGAFPLVGVVAEGILAKIDDPADPGMLAEPNHSHLVVVPGTAWGDETPWLFDVAQHLAGARPVRTVLVNGGPIAQLELEESLRRGLPAIAIRGTGRAADEQPGTAQSASAGGYDRHLVVVADSADIEGLRRRLVGALRDDAWTMR